MSFLSDKNINKLQYQLRQIFPENKWVAIQESVQSSALIWFKQHSDQLQLIYQRDGIEGLNKKFISDMIASAEYFDHTNAPDFQQNNLFDTDIGDPNIVADQPMPYVSGVENPMFVFSTFEKTYGANGQPETKLIYREKPSYGGDGSPFGKAVSHTLQGPGPRSGPVRHYSDTGYLPQVTNRDAFNIGERLTQGFNPGTSCKLCPSNQQQNYVAYKASPNRYNITPPMPSTSPYYSDMPTYANGSYPYDQPQLGFSQRGNKIQNDYRPDPYQPTYNSGQIPDSGMHGMNQKYNQLGYTSSVQQPGMISKILNKIRGNRHPFSTKEDDSLVITGNYGENMSKNIYNTAQSKFFPNAYDGYKLGKKVEEYSPDDGDYVPYPNNVMTKTVKTINQLTFGDVPVAMEMSNDQIAELGHQLYRNKDTKKRQRAPRQNGKCIPRQEYVDLHDDYPTNQVRAKFHLDQIYNTPESRINTILDPVMGKSNMWMSQERSTLEIPCGGMSRVPGAPKASDRYTNTRVYADGFADSYAVPGCNAFNSVPRRQAYPNRDFVPARYTTTYGRY